MISNQSFDAAEFFRFAGEIIRDSNANEAALRSAISRTYYSIFLIARDRLFGMDEVQYTNNIEKQIAKKYELKTKIKKQRLGTHERVIFAIQDKTNNITLSQQIAQLREARIKADYRMNQQCLTDIGKQSWREYAEETIELAALVLHRVKNLPSY